LHSTLVAAAAAAAAAGIAWTYGRAVLPCTLFAPSPGACRNLGVSITTLVRNFARIVALERADVAPRDRSSLCK